MANQNFNIGDIFYSSWGYNTTRVTFYQVVEVIGKCTAILSEVESISTPSDLNEYWINKTPSKNNFIGNTIRKRISKNSFKIDDRMYAFKWDGKPLSASSDYSRFNN